MIPTEEGTFSLTSNELLEKLSHDDKNWNSLTRAKLVHISLGPGTVSRVEVRRAPHWPLFYVLFGSTEARFNDRLFRNLQGDRLYLIAEDPDHRQLYSLVADPLHPAPERSTNPTDRSITNNANVPFGPMINKLSEKERSIQPETSQRSEPLPPHSTSPRSDFTVESAPQTHSENAGLVSTLARWCSGAFRRLRRRRRRKPPQTKVWIEPERQRPRWMQADPAGSKKAFSARQRVTPKNSTRVAAIPPSPKHTISASTSPSIQKTLSRSLKEAMPSSPETGSSPVGYQRLTPRISPYTPAPNRSNRWLIPANISELHYITHISNVPSILMNGIHSHNGAQQFDPVSVAMPEVNARRHGREVENGWTVHDHANLYFNARNPMMYVRKEHHQSLCVLRISTQVFEEKWIAVTDGNAASGNTRFFTDREFGLAQLDFGLIYSDGWTHVLDGKRRKCAEVLVLHRVPPHHIFGAYVSCVESKRTLALQVPLLSATINEHLFFQSAHTGFNIRDWTSNDIPF